LQTIGTTGMRSRQRKSNSSAKTATDRAEIGEKFARVAFAVAEAFARGYARIDLVQMIAPGLSCLLRRQSMLRFGPAFRLRLLCQCKKPDRPEHA